MNAKEVFKQAAEKHGDSWWNEVHEDCENQTNRDWVIEELFAFVKASGYKVKVFQSLGTVVRHEEGTQIP